MRNFQNNQAAGNLFNLFIPGLLVNGQKSGFVSKAGAVTSTLFNSESKMLSLGRILFSSGTPISNTMAELYLLFKYLRPNKMKETGITSFDGWAANFANDYSDLEYYIGRFKEVQSTDRS